MSFTISHLHAREVLDSRGNPTLEVELSLSDGSQGRGMAPSGASKGEHEAIELRDGDPTRYFGKGTKKAVSSVNEKIDRAIKGRTFETLSALDGLLIELDGSSQKGNLGANAILATSLAFAWATSQSKGIPLYSLFNAEMGLGEGDLRMPVPLMNILNGGVHANNGLEIQEFMIVPHGFANFSEALMAGCTVFHNLKKKLDALGLSTAVGDEGGFAPSVGSNERALEIIMEAIEASGYTLGRQISLALDVAASSFFDRKIQKYHFRTQNEAQVTSRALLEFYSRLVTRFPIVSIEDPLDENDWAGWKELTSVLGGKCQIVGDDIFVTQKARLEKGIVEKVGNAILVKVNQVGSLSETFDTMRLAKGRGFGSIVSHRSGETEDVTIAHLAVASGCGQIKTGSLSRGERTAKYNELLRIEERSQIVGKPIGLAKFGRY